MGLERKVTIEGEFPAWQHVVEAMKQAGFSLEMRMIDGELAFPDELPPESWRELRVAHRGAMLTIRRSVGEVILVTWGNADDEQLHVREQLAEAFTRSSSKDRQS